MIALIEKEHEMLAAQLLCVPRFTGFKAFADLFKYHTLDEESCMDVEGYTHKAEHIEAHKQLLVKLINLDATEPLPELKSMILRTVQDHIDNYDKELLEHLKRMS